MLRKTASTRSKDPTSLWQDRVAYTTICKSKPLWTFLYKPLQQVGLPCPPVCVPLSHQLCSPCPLVILLMTFPIHPSLLCSAGPPVPKMPRTPLDPNSWLLVHGQTCCRVCAKRHLWRCPIPSTKWLPMSPPSSHPPHHHTPALLCTTSTHVSMCQCWWLFILGTFAIGGPRPLCRNSNISSAHGRRRLRLPPAPPKKPLLRST